ncbi:MAG: transcription elongation factor GreA [Chloroflexota bacterium]
MSREAEYVVTPEGLATLKSELKKLQTVRLPQVAEKMNQARENEAGAMEDNVEYEETLKEWSFIKGRILTLEHTIAHAKVVNHQNSKGSPVGVGSKVTVRYQDGKVEMYHIVGSAEVNPSRGQISNISPVGQSLLGKKIGDEIEVAAPSGRLKLQVIAIG